MLVFPDAWCPPGSPPEPPPCAYWVSHEITASLQGLAIGAPQVHRNLALFPLLAPTEAAGGALAADGRVVHLAGYAV